MGRCLPTFNKQGQSTFRKGVSHHEDSCRSNFRYQLAQPGKTTVKIYNTLGQSVKTVVEAYQQQGVYSVNWDGKDNSGKTAANGVYIYRLESGDFKATKKMVILK